MVFIPDKLRNRIVCQAVLDGKLYLDIPFVAFQNLIYDYYSKELSVKTKASRRQMAEHGLYKSTNALYGYRKDQENKRKLLVVPEEAAVVRDIFDMRLGGMELADIARTLNGRDITSPAARLINRDERKDYHGHTDGFISTAASVSNILKNEEYTGALVTHKSESKGPGCKKDSIKKRIGT